MWVGFLLGKNLHTRFLPVGCGPGLRRGDELIRAWLGSPGRRKMTPVRGQHGALLILAWEHYQLLLCIVPAGGGYPCGTHPSHRAGAGLGRGL